MTIQTDQLPGLRGALARTRRVAGAASGSSRSPFGIPLRIFLGRALLAVLFLVVPVFNPAVLSAGDERFYMGGVVVIVAALLMLPSLLSRRFDWIAVGLAFGALYVLEAGLLRGDLTLGVLGNVYRPIHAVLAFGACAVFLLGADRDRWVRLFLAGGLIGCSLAVLNTVVPAIDPFAISRPDIGYEAKFLRSERQSGAFVYPGNFGPYAAYVALVALVMVERKRIRPLSLNLYTAAFLFGVLAMLTSGSRGAAVGFLLGAAVVLWRSPQFRVPVAATVVVVGVVVSVALLAAGTFREIVESRLLLADFSFEERLRSWGMAWDGLRHSVLFGAGVIPNTIDNTVIYYLGVGGVVGLALVAAMYWTTLLRPTRMRDWANLPIVVAVGGVGLTQEALGTPLTSWAIAAAVFLTTTPAREREILAPSPRPLDVRRNRRTAAVAAASLVALALLCAGAVTAGRIPADQLHTSRPILEVSATVELPASTRAASSSAEVAVATASALDAETEPLWLIRRERARADAVRYRFESVAEDGDVDEAAQVDGTLSARVDATADVAFDVVQWRPDEDARLAVMQTGRGRVDVTTAEASGGAIARHGTASLPAAPEGARDVALALWSGETPDLFVIDHADRPGRVSVSVYSGESRFGERVLSAQVPDFPAQDVGMTADIARVSGDVVDLVLFTRRGPTDKPEIHVLSGESRFREFVLQVPIELDAADANGYEFALGTRLGRPVLYAASDDGDSVQLDVIPLEHLP